ncbi:tetratricopeptide repeat protein [bacterium]|nr:tetratricopeptide repeat protein [bacterium]
MELRNQFLEQPENLSLLEKLEVEYSTSENWEELLNIYHVFTEKTEDELLVSKYTLKKALIYDEMLMQTDKAIDELKHLISYEPFTLHHFKYFESLCRSISSFDVLIEVYQSVLTKVEDDQKILFYYELASLSLQQNSFNSAAEYLDSALGIDEMHPESLNLLDFIFNKKQGDIELLVILEPIYRKIGEWEKLLLLFNSLISLYKQNENFDELKSILEKKIELLENSFPERDEQIFETLLFGYQLDQNRDDYFEKLEQYADQLNTHQTVVTTLIKIYENSDKKTFLSYKIGTISYTLLNDSKVAKKYLLEYVKNGDIYYEEAFQYLIEILNNEENYNELVFTFLKQADYIEDISSKIDVLKEAAFIYQERLFQLPQAINLYQKMISLTPEETTFYFELEKLYEQSQDWSSLLVLIGKMREYVDNVEEYDKKRAYIFDQKLQNYEEAIRYYLEFLTEYGYVENQDIVQRVRALYEELNKYDELISFLENYKEFIIDQDESEKIEYQLAEILSAKFERYEEAYQKLISILDMNPEHEDAIKLLFKFIQEKRYSDEIYNYLDSLFESTDNISYQIKLNQMRIKMVASKEEQSQLCYKVAKIYLDRSSEVGKAYDYFIASIQLSPNLEYYAELKEYVESMGFEERLIESLKKIVSSLTKESELYQIALFDLGRVLFQFSNYSEAEQYFAKVIEIESHHKETLQYLDEIYSSLEKYNQLFNILKLKEEIEDEKVEILYRLRDIALDQFKNKEKALPFIYKLYDLDSYSQQEHQDTLISYLEELQKWDELAEFYKRIIEVVPEPQYIEAAADIQFKYIKNIEYSAELYEQILDNTENRLKVLSNLEKIYESLENYERLISILEEKFEFLKAEGDKTSLIPLMFKMGKIYLEKVEKFERASRMFSFLIKAKYDENQLISYLEGFIANIEILPHIYDVLEQLYNSTEKWENLISLHEKWIETLQDSEQIPTLLKIAEIYHEQVKNYENAITYYDKIFLFTQEREILSTIEELVEETKNYKRVIEIFENYLETIDFPDIDLKIDLYLKVSELYKSKLNNSEKTSHFLSLAYELDEQNIEVLDKYISSLNDIKSFEKMKDLYYRKIELLDDQGELLLLKLEVSKFLVEKFRDFEKAIILLGEILEWDPLEERAIKFLLKLNDFLKIEQLELKLKILDILKPVYIDSSRYDELDSLYGLVINMQGVEDSLKIELMKDEMKQFFDISEIDRGMKKYQETLLLSKGDSEILQLGVNYAEITNDFDRLIQIYQTLLVSLRGDEKSVDVYLLMGDISHRYMGDFQQAEKYFLVVLEKNPEHIEALNKLESMYNEYGEYDKLRGIYNKLISIIKDTKTLFEIYQKQGYLLYDHLGDIDGGVECFEKARELNHSDEALLGKLFDYYKAEESFEAIIPILEDFLKIYPKEVYHLNRAAYYYLKLFKYQKEKTTLLKRAVELAEISYEISSETAQTELILLECYKDLENYEKVATLYLSKLNRASSKDEQIEIQVQLATIYAQHLNQIEKAQDCVSFIREHDPYNKQILDVREQILFAQKSWSELIALLDEKIEFAEDDKLGEIIFTKVKIYMEQLNQPSEALNLIKDLIQNNSENSDYLFYAEKIFSSMDNLKGYFDFIKGRIPEVESNELKASIFVRMGSIAYHNFNKEDLSIKCYNKAFEYKSDSMEAISGLKEIAKNKSDYNMYVNLLNMEIKKATGEKKLQLREELIDLYLNKLKQPEMVIPFKEEDYDNDRDNQTLMLELIELYSNSTESFNFFNYFDDFFNILKTDRNFEDRHVYMVYLGRACRNASEYDKAISCYETANRLKMGYIPGQMELGTMLMEMGDSEGALKVFQMLQLNQAKIEDNQMKIDLFLNIGRLRGAANDALRAKSAYKKVLEFDSENQEAKDYLDNH